MDMLMHGGKYVFTNGPPPKEPEQPLLELEHEDTLTIKTESRDLAQKKVTAPIRQDKPANSATSATSTESAPSSRSASEKLALDSSTPSPISPLTDPDVDVSVCASSSLVPLTELNVDVSVCNSSIPQPLGSTPQVVLPCGDQKSQLENSRTKEDNLATSSDDARISSWASDVDAADLEQDFTTLTSPKNKTASVSDKSVHSPASLDIANQKFTNLHHQAPKYLNDISQPRNADYNGPKLKKSKSSTPSIILKSPAKKFEQIGESGYLMVLEAGKFYIAAKAQKANEITRKNKPAIPGIKLEVREGDQIKINKPVSGLLYHATNVRTKENGQVSANMFPKLQSTDNPASQFLYTRANEEKATAKNLAVDNLAANVVASEKLVDDQPRTQQSVKTSSLSQHRGLPEWGSFEAIDVIETLNAAEWENDDDEPIPESAKASDDTQISEQSQWAPRPLEAANTNSPLGDMTVRQEQQIEHPSEQPWRSASTQKRKFASPAVARPGPTSIIPGTSSRFALLDDEVPNESFQTNVCKAINMQAKVSIVPHPV